MSIYPIRITKKTFRYTRAGSDKEYHTVMIHRADGVALGIYRWGKTGAWGQMDFVRGNSSAVATAIGKKEREKTGKGYEEQKHASVSAENAADLIDKLGTGYYYKLGEHLPYLDPDAPADGVRAAEPPGFDVDKDGRYRKKEAPPKLVEEEPEPPVESRYANDPLFGAF